jgi:hypothetical protein
MASKAKRKAARRRKAETRKRPEQPPTPVPQRNERPPAPWGSFPLTQLSVLAGLVLMVIGFISGGLTPLVVGLLLGSAAGLELSIREHFAGYRSHTTLLSGVIFMVAAGVTYFLVGWVLWVCLAIAATLFGVSFGLMRRAFQTASGGLSFRVR